MIAAKKGQARIVSMLLEDFHVPPDIQDDVRCTFGMQPNIYIVTLPSLFISMYMNNVSMAEHFYMLLPMKATATLLK